jgi:hypothetical protein
MWLKLGRKFQGIIHGDIKQFWKLTRKKYSMKFLISQFQCKLKLLFGVVGGGKETDGNMQHY